MSARRPHIVLMSQEVWPLVPGGGIGRYVRDASRALAEHADVTVLTREAWRPRYEELLARGEDPAAPGVAFAWAPEPPADVAPFRSWFHASAAAFLEGLRAVARERPVDLVEYDDFRGIGAVVADAVRAEDPLLRNVVTVVRQDTAWEITQLLDGLDTESETARWIAAVERQALRRSAALISASSEALSAYRDYYGPAALPGRTAVIRRPNPAIPTTPPPAPAPAAEGLHLLYVGRLQECKGVRSLVRAVRRLDAPDVRLTLVGGDTDSGPGASSMRRHLELLAGGDPRIAFRGRVDPAELARIYAAHHIVVMPSRFESHGYVAREALAQDRPVLVTPVGGLHETVVEGRSGWLAADLTDDALLHALDGLLADPGTVDRMIAERGPSGVLHELAGDAGFAGAYLELLASVRDGGEDAAPVAAVGAASPGDGVTALVRVGGRGARLAATLDALDAQTSGRPEIVLVAEDLAVVPVGALERVDAAYGAEVGEELHDAGRRGLRGRSRGGPVLLLEAGDVPGADFLERTLPLLTREDVAYMSSWGTGRGRGNTPIGNAAATIVGQPGVAASVVLAGPEVAAVLVHAEIERAYAELTSLGLHGLVVPEPLVGRMRAGRRLPYPPAPLSGVPAARVFLATGD